KRPRLELVVPLPSAAERSRVRPAIVEAVQGVLSAVKAHGLRVTLSLLAPGEPAWHETWQSTPRENGLRPIELWGIHPEAAQRVDLSRYENFHLERLRSEEHTSELQSRENLVCRLLLEKKKRGHAQAHTATYRPGNHHRVGPQDRTRHDLPRRHPDGGPPIRHRGHHRGGRSLLR